MKTLLIGILSGVVACGFALAQDAPPTNTTARPSQQIPATQSNQSNAATGTPQIAPGSVIPVQLTKTIDAKKVKTGDEVEAKVTQDLKAGNGEVVVPKDTKVMGHVTEAQARNKEQKESQVGIAFDHAITKNGADMALPLSIQAIIAQPNPNAGNADAGESVSQSPSAQGAGAMPSSNGGGRSGGMGGGTPPPSPGPPVAGESTNAGTNANPPITANTQGVIGISSLHLSMAPNAEGSIVSSDKGNVKLEGGTLMLLKVTK